MAEQLSPRMQLLLEAPISEALWRLATPNVLAVATMTAVTVADAFFVGQLGVKALASLALVFPFQTLMQMMAGGAIGGGVTSALARALGARDQARAEAVTWHALLIALVMAGLYLVVLGIFARPIFELLGGTGEVLEGAVLYASIVFGGSLAMWLMNVFASMLRGTGDTTTPARAIMVASCTQVAASGALTLGWGPFPQLGIAGPATALVLCFAGTALYLGWFLVSGRASVRLHPRKLQWRPVGAIMAVGGIGIINSVTIAATIVVVTGFVGRYGTEALAGYGLGSRLELMLVPIAFGIGAALTAAVGTNFGASQYERARKIASTGACITFAITGAIGIAVALAPGLWLDQFTANAEAYAYGALYLSIAGPCYGLFGGGQALYFASQGTGQMLLPVLVGLARFLVVLVVGSIAVARGWDVSAVFIGVSAGLAVIGIGLGLSLLTPVWRPRIAA
jgi:putative MATE family efflux protein